VISTTKLRAALQLPTTFSEVLLGDLRDRAVAFVERQTGRYFGLPVEQVDILTGTGTRHLSLTELVVDGEAVAVIEQEYAGADATGLEPSTGFQVRHTGYSSVLTRVGGDRWALDREYLVTYTRGYVVDSGPGDIEQLIVALVGLRIAGMGADGIQTETIGGYSYSKYAIHAYEDGDMRSIPGAVRTIEAWKGPVFA
jgi:hypothetical protein